MVEMILIAYIVGICTFIHGIVGFMVEAVKLWVDIVLRRGFVVGCMMTKLVGVYKSNTLAQT